MVGLIFQNILGNHICFKPDVCYIFYFFEDDGCFCKVTIKKVAFSQAFSTSQYHVEPQ